MNQPTKERIEWVGMPLHADDEVAAEAARRHAQADAKHDAEHDMMQMQCQQDQTRDAPKPKRELHCN
jgi:hypothetical protein